MMSFQKSRNIKTAKRNSALGCLACRLAVAWKPAAGNGMLRRLEKEDKDCRFWGRLASVVLKYRDMTM